MTGPEAGQHVEGGIAGAVEKAIGKFDQDQAEYYVKGLPVVAFRYAS